MPGPRTTSQMGPGPRRRARRRWRQRPVLPTFWSHPMDLGVGLPISNPHRLVDWATRAEAAGFASLGLLDRLVFDNPEPLVALAVLAGATDRIRLQTEVLLGPLRSTALLAKQVATLDVMSGGRFTLGIGVGGRADDHEAAGTPLAQRGRLLEQQLVDLRRIWSDGTIGPRPATPGGPPILIGGFAPAALARIARYGTGFLCAAPLRWAGPLVDGVTEQWQAAGRPGRPRLVCQVNVATRRVPNGRGRRSPSTTRSPAGPAGARPSPTRSRSPTRSPRTGR